MITKYFLKQRNQTTKIRAKSDEKCISNFKKTPKEYWDTIKPFILDKANASSQPISLNVDKENFNDPNLGIIFRIYVIAIIVLKK